MIEKWATALPASSIEINLSVAGKWNSFTVSSNSATSVNSGVLTSSIPDEFSSIIDSSALSEKESASG